MHTLVVVGLGKVGSLVGLLLSKRFSVTGFDRQAPATPLPFPISQGDVTDTEALKKALLGADGVVSCLPYNLNLPIARVAYELGIHYFDLTEDVPTTDAIRLMAATAKGVMARSAALPPASSVLLAPTWPNGSTGCATSSCAWAPCPATQTGCWVIRLRGHRRELSTNTSTTAR